MGQKDNASLATNLATRFMKLGGPVKPTLSTANVSNPPTDAQLDAAFAAPASLPDPFLAVVDDAGLGTTMWLVLATNGAWFYAAALTKAV